MMVIQLSGTTANTQMALVSLIPTKPGSCRSRQGATGVREDRHYFPRSFLILNHLPVDGPVIQSY
jgi:hypothetical protein